VAAILVSGAWLTSQVPTRPFTSGHAATPTLKLDRQLDLRRLAR
jgi:hypothetical protein